MAGCVALIVAAGRGARLGAARTAGAPSPKQYLPLCGRPMLTHAVAAFQDADGVAAMRVVIHADDRALYDDAVGHLGLLDPVQGGATRQDSVRLGLESLAGEGFETVLIHDAARPLVDGALIARTLAALAAHPGAVPALAVRDSLKRGAGGVIREAVDRSDLWRAQTPQGFSFAAILDAHRKAAAEGPGAHSDDAAVAAAAGIDVVLVPGSEGNLKITTMEDFARAERLLAGGG
ncbi:MAG: 2-C-methyl-D-erythritol 4-phosphate cytidylyltransferase, partial [Alphaproteobacteria bacterium]